MSDNLLTFVVVILILIGIPGPTVVGFAMTEEDADVDCDNFFTADSIVVDIILLVNLNLFLFLAISCLAPLSLSSMIYYKRIQYCTCTTTWVKSATLYLDKDFMWRCGVVVDDEQSTRT